MKFIVPFAAAWMFLTRLPFPFRVHIEAKDLARSVGWFPWVGALIGVGVSSVIWCGVTYLSLNLGVLLGIVAGLLLTGALHEDGLADTVDGMFGGRDRERRLEIMKDSRIGSYGVIALIMTLFIRYELLTHLIKMSSLMIWVAPMMGHSLSRGACSIMMLTMPYARGDEGKSGRLFEGLSWREGVWAILGSLLVGGVLVGVKLVVFFVMLTGVILLFANFYKKKIGGITGDCLGALQQFSEILIYITICLTIT